MTRRSAWSEDLRFGPYKIAKAHIEGRRYRTVVMDMRRPAGDRQIFWVRSEGWTQRTRQIAREHALMLQENDAIFGTVAAAVVR